MPINKPFGSTLNKISTPAAANSNPADTNESKVINGKYSDLFTATSKLHVNPSNVTVARSQILTNKLKPFSDEDDVSESMTDANITPYKSKTGFLDTEPATLLMSEFIPIFGGDDQIHKSLNLKEKSFLITSKNASIAFSQEATTRKYIEENKNSILSLGKNPSFSILLGKLSTIYELLKIQNFEDNRATINSKHKSFTASLENSYGADNVKNYLNTKVWNQFLIDTKRKMKDDFGVNPPVVNEAVKKDPVLLSGLDDTTSGRIRPWINVFFDLPALTEMFTPSDETLERTITTIVGTYDKLYVDINQKDKAVSINSWLDNFASSGRDLSIISSIITKEFNYSYYILENSAYVRNTFGYDINGTADESQSFLDYLIGKFTKSAIEIPKVTTGNGSSLLDFSFSNTQNNLVFTFENNYIEGQKFSPGTYYYIDSALKTVDGQNFDTVRLSEFQNKISTAMKTVNALLEMYSPANQRSRTSSSGLLDFLRTKFDFLKDIYISIADSPRSPSYEDSKNTYAERIASSIFKMCTLSPENKGKFDASRVKRVRAIIFMMSILPAVPNIDNRQFGIIYKILSKKLDTELTVENFSDFSPEIKTETYSFMMNDILETKTFQEMFKLMRFFAEDSPSKIFLPSNGLTAFSKVDKVIFFLAHFDLLVRSISSMTADNLLSSRNFKNNIFRAGEKISKSTMTPNQNLVQQRITRRIS